jgi:hypothetical protein
MISDYFKKWGNIFNSFNNQKKFSEEQWEFIKLVEKFVELAVSHSLLTLKAFRNRKRAPLTKLQAKGIIDFNIQFFVQKLQDVEFLDIVREESFLAFLEKENFSK